MRSVACASVLLPIFALSASSDDDSLAKFEKFQRDYHVVYPTEEERNRRYEIFVQNLKKIADLNLIPDNIQYDITKFTDRTEHEFLSLLIPLEHQEARISSSSAEDDKFIHAGEKYPLSFSHRDKCDTGVHDQGQCGSCWAFSTVASIESHYCVKTGELLNLSERQLVDCDYNQFGCNGASDLLEPLNFAASGLVDSERYKYHDGHFGECNIPKDAELHAKFEKAIDLTAVGADKLGEAIAKYGSLSIGIDASRLSFYRSGILDKGNCRGTQLNHAVTAVGYVVDNEETKDGYFIVKNSWGSGWGEEGFFRVRYNACVAGVIAARPDFGEDKKREQEETIRM